MLEKRLNRQRFPESRNSKGGKQRREFTHKCSIQASMLSSSCKSQKHCTQSVRYPEVQESVNAGSNLCLASVNLHANKSTCRALQQGMKFVTRVEAGASKETMKLEEQICSANEAISGELRTQCVIPLQLGEVGEHAHHSGLQSFEQRQESGNDKRGGIKTSLTKTMHSTQIASTRMTVIDLHAGRDHQAAFFLLSSTIYSQSKPMRMPLVTHPRPQTPSEIFPPIKQIVCCLHPSHLKSSEMAT